MVGPPGVRVVGPRIGSRLYGVEPVAALGIGDAAPAAEEIRVDRRVVGVVLMNVAARGIGLPQLDQQVRDWPSVLVQDPPGDHDPLAKWGAVLGRIPGHIVVQRVDAVMPEDRARQLRQTLCQRHQRLGRSAQHGRLVVGVHQGRMARPVARVVGLLRQGLSPQRNV